MCFLQELGAAEAVATSGNFFYYSDIEDIYYLQAQSSCFFPYPAKPLPHKIVTNSGTGS
ncbi:MAG: hypothetical protein M3162_04860 [Thermoproteota archaeon]|nr:hypothetical protein [Thermoproteota archaeon]